MRFLHEPEYDYFPGFRHCAADLRRRHFNAQSKFKAVKEDGVNPKHFLLNKGAKLPDYLAKANNHYANLFEAPVLFYVVCLIIYAGNKADSGYVVLAWLFAGLRYAHAYIHITYNELRHRMLVFLASMMVLAIMWIRLAIQLAAF